MIKNPFSKDTEQDAVPNSIMLRPGQLEDDQAAFDVMRRAMGLDMTWSQHSTSRRHLRTAPNSSFWLAEETLRLGRSRIIGYAHSTVRDDMLQITEFFVLPSHHGQGIGRALLANCLNDGDRMGAKRRFVLASHSAAANRLYMLKAGCFPRVPMLLLAGNKSMLIPPADSAPVLDTHAAPNPFRLISPNKTTLQEPILAQPVILTNTLQNELDALDRRYLGYTRASEHQYWAFQTGGEEGSARIFRSTSSGSDAGKIVGYIYYGGMSSGPALAVNPSDLPRMISHVTSIRPRNSRRHFNFPDNSEPYWAVAGTNTVVLDWMLRCDWKIVYHYLYMSTDEPPALDHYLGHNPLHFF